MFVDNVVFFHVWRYNNLGLNAHMEATCRGSLLGLVLRCGTFGGLFAPDSDFRSEGTGDPAGRTGETFAPVK